MIPIDRVEKRIFDIHGNQLKIDCCTYEGTSKKATFIDEKYGEWIAYVSNVLAGHCHPLRGKERSQQTNLKKYGSISPLGGKDIRQKIEQTCAMRYGNKNPMASNVIREKLRMTLLERYGVDNPQKIPFVREKTRVTCRERYGTDAPLQSEHILKKSKETCFLHYGVENPMQDQAIREKSKETCRKKYGVDNPAQNIDVYRKTLTSKRKAVTCKHWKTGEKLTCIGSYETAVVGWLNKNNVDFDWQVKIDIPDCLDLGKLKGKTYIIDLQVKSVNPIVPVGTFVEIKGYWMQEISKLKWEWFHSVHPNSALWTGQVLKSLGILGHK